MMIDHFVTGPTGGSCSLIFAPSMWLISSDYHGGLRFGQTPEKNNGWFQPMPLIGGGEGGVPLGLTTIFQAHIGSSSFASHAWRLSWLWPLHTKMLSSSSPHNAGLACGSHVTKSKYMSPFCLKGFQKRPVCGRVNPIGATKTTKELHGFWNLPQVHIVLDSSLLCLTPLQTHKREVILGFFFFLTFCFLFYFFNLLTIF